MKKMIKSKKNKVSLLVTCYNCSANLEKTLSGIDEQDYPNIEVVIVDGNSSDGTVDIIRNYEKNGKYDCKWISEKDKGIYDALNKGYQLSTGDIIAVCNDQFLMKNAVSLMVNVIVENGADGAHADLIYATDTAVKRYWRMGNGKIQSGWMPGHPTLYLKREVYENYGLYDIDYRCSADYEFMIRILANQDIKLIYVPHTIIRMYYGGTSTAGVSNYWLSLKEAHQALVENHIPHPFLVDFLRTVRVFLQFLNAKKYKDYPKKI